MGKIIICKITWSVSKALEMASEADYSVKKMDGNAAVPTPPIALTDMTEAAKAVRDTYPNRDGTDIEKNAYESAVSNLNSMLHEQVLYVNEKANGSEAIILSCGFTPTSDTKTPSVVPDQVTSVKLTAMAGGKVKAIIEKPNNANGLFIVIYTGAVVPLAIQGKQITIPDGVTGVQLVPRGKKVMTFTSFSGVPLVTVVAYGTSPAGIGAASNPISTKTL